MAAAFGVALSGRAFANWIANGLRAAQVTGENAEQIKAAKEAFDAFKAASDELALSFASSLTPAITGFAHAMTGLNAAFFNADPTPFGKQIEDLRDALRAIDKQAIDTGIGFKSYSKEQQAEIARLNAAIDELIKKQRLALGLDQKAGPLAIPPFHRIGDFADRNKGAKRADFAIDYLDEFEEIAVEARKISEDEILKPFPAAEVRAMFEPIKNDGREFARTLGAGFRDSFVDVFMGIDVSFKDLLRRMAAEMAVSGIFSTIAGALGGSTGGVGKFFANFFGGFRAQGGPLSPGKWYIAGEKGPEPVWGGGSGAFAMASAPGGGVNVTYNIDARGATQELVQRLPAILAANNRQLKAEISDSRRRGRPI
jgi:hypothetical protein